jgi:phage terminase large subunit
MSADSLTLPYNWRPRDYQLPAWRYLEHGGKRAVLCWHRRSGKDDVMLHHTACQMVQRAGNYWHMLPQANQARKAVWDAINPHTGKRRIDEAFPVELRETTREQEMMIRFRPTSMSPASTWQVVGSDNYQSLIGSPPISVAYSEYALSDPNSWAFLRPILLENGGTAAFISTPRGRNHFQRLLALAQSEPGWFAQTLTVADTGVMSDEAIARERRELTAERGEDEAENIINQEYYCSFDAAIPGSYYGKIIAKLEAQGRICDVPHDPRLPVFTAWDLGVGDSTAIWFAQQTRAGSVRIIDYYENAGVGADHYARIVSERGYNYEGHYLPHDADDREWGNNATSRVETLKSLKVRPTRVLPRASVDDGVNAVRVLLPRCSFDAVKCERGLDALRQYQKTWDEKLRTFSLRPLHDWSSHAADAFRYLAQGLRAPRDPDAQPLRVESDYRVLP